MEARAGLPDFQISAPYQCLTDQNGGKETCGVQGEVANHIDPPPKPQEKAPATAGTRAEAVTTSLAANGVALDSLAYWQTQFVIIAHGVRPEIAAMMAALAFGRACA